MNQSTMHRQVPLQATSPATPSHAARIEIAAKALYAACEDLGRIDNSLSEYCNSMTGVGIQNTAGPVPADLAGNGGCINSIENAVNQIVAMTQRLSSTAARVV